MKRFGWTIRDSPGTVPRAVPFLLKALNVLAIKVSGGSQYAEF